MCNYLLASRAGEAQSCDNAPKGGHQGRVMKGSKVSQAGVFREHLCDAFHAVRIAGVDLVKLFVQTLFVEGVPTLVHSDAVDRRPPTAEPCVASDRHGGGVQLLWRGSTAAGKRTSTSYLYDKVNA